MVTVAPRRPRIEFRADDPTLTPNGGLALVAETRRVLDVDDVAVSARRGRLTVRSGKGDLGREVPLNSACRSVLDTWTKARDGQIAGLRSDEPRTALWLSRTGNRMSPRAIDLVIRGLADDAGLAVSAHVLRHTWVTNLVRSGADVVLVAEIAGHARLDTTRRYINSRELHQTGEPNTALRQLAA